MHDHSRHIPVEIKNPRQYAKGGLASAAGDVAKAGEGGDTMIVHMNKIEFDQLRKEWGEPTINPKTGMPSYSWGSWLGPLAGVLGAATGIGGSIGDAIGGATGLVDAGSTASNALGSGLLGAGVGALSGGGKGALYGGIAGGATPFLTSALGLGGSGGSLFGGLGDAAGMSASDGQSLLNNPLGAAQGPTASGATLDAAGKAASGTGGGMGLSSILNGSGKGGYLPLAMMGLVAANALGQNRGPSAAQQAAQTANSAAVARNNQSLPTVNFSRMQTNPLANSAAYKRYGYGPAQNFFTGNQLGSTSSGYAQGGQVQSGGGLQAMMPKAQGGVGGPGTGRSDDIPARLSDGEYVLDAETMAMLGDGSSKAGAARMDQMREAVRRHKGGALAQGKISPDAKSPLAYMGGRG